MERFTVLNSLNDPSVVKNYHNGYVVNKLLNKLNKKYSLKVQTIMSGTISAGLVNLTNLTVNGLGAGAINTTNLNFNKRL